MAGRQRGIVIQISGDGESAKAALKMVQEQLHETAESAEESGSRISSAMERVKAVLEYTMAFEGLRMAMEGLKELTAGSVELGMEIGHLSKQTGISSENLSTLKYVSDQTGVGFDTLQKGFKKLSVEMLGAEEGQKASITNFQRLGITQQEVVAHSHDLFGMMEIIADKFKSMPDGPLKAAEAQALFGKSGMALIPILDQGRDAIEEMRGRAQALGLVLSEDTIEKMEELHSKVLDAKGAFEGLGLSLTDILEPAFANFALGASTAIQNLRELIDLTKELPEADADKQKKSYDAIPDKVLGMSDSQRGEFASAARQREQDAQDELARLDGMRMRGALSEKEFAAKSLKLQKETDDAKLAQAQAAVVGQEEIAQNLQQRLLDIQQGPKGPLTYGAAQGARQDLANANTSLAAAYKNLMALQKAAKENAPSLNDIVPVPGSAKGEDGIARALAEQAAEQGKATAAARKAIDEQMLSELEAQHKMLLVSDQDFYDEKLRLQNDALDAEIEGLRSKQATLQALYEKQHSDKTLKRDKSGNSSEELRTAKELLEVQTQIGALETHKDQNKDANTSATFTSSQKAELDGLKRAADLEKERNAGIEAQIALIRREHELQAQNLGLNGDDAGAAQARSLGDMAVKKLQIEDLNRRIASTEEDTKLQVEAVNDAVAKGALGKRTAEKEINALNAAEADQLRALAAQYDELAAELGGPFVEAARKLHAEIDKLNTPSQKGNAQFAKELGDGVESMAERISSAALKGKQSFHEMANSIIQDLLQMSIKLSMDAWLKPLLDGAFAGAGAAVSMSSPGADSLHFHADGTDFAPGGLSVVGEKGPELVDMPRGAGVTPNSTLQKLADSSSGGAGRGVSIVSNVINQTSNPVSAQPSQVSYDEELRSFVIHTVLQDQATGGPIAQANQGG